VYPRLHGSAGVGSTATLVSTPGCVMRSTSTSGRPSIASLRERSVADKCPSRSHTTVIRPGSRCARTRRCRPSARGDLYDRPRTAGRSFAGGHSLTVRAQQHKAGLGLRSPLQHVNTKAVGGSISRAGDVTRGDPKRFPGSRSSRPSHPLGLVRVYSSAGVSPRFRSVAPRIESCTTSYSSRQASRASGVSEGPRVFSRLHIRASPTAG
jgi:hypothetical protein